MKLTQAQIAAIKALENSRGQITPRQVVQAAKNKRSPLHPLFNWDLRRAAEHWWEHRARVILSAPVLQVQTQEFSYKTSAYIIDTEAEGQGYRSVVALKNDPASARESLVYTLEVAAGHLRRAMDLAAPLGLSKEIDKLLARIAGVQRIAQKKAA